MPRSVKPLLISAGVAVAAAALALLSYAATKPEEAGTTVQGAPRGQGQSWSEAADPKLLALARRDPADAMAVGRPDAPVVLIEYADYQCGYCAKHARDTAPALIEKYVKDGTLRIEWRNATIFGEQSEAAARAAWAAGRQGRFQQFHAAAYAEGVKEQGFGPDRLKALAEEAGVPDLDRFLKDTDGPEARAALKKDQDEAARIGVRSTPSFLINGHPVSGAQPLEYFTAAVKMAADRPRTQG
ncbi:thioredoxin domain-containing protein [Streptomyces sp. NPDC097619]|uniref:DsbA family protein n=1 Tax=Streptomyces sp. NPDC097619 TaxID=3157228 RepID=UPI003325DEA2